MSDKELASAGVLAGVRHAQRTGAVFVGVEVGFTLNLVAGTAGTYPWVAGLFRQGIASLNHEVLDDTMESGPVVELTVCQLLKVADSAWHFGIEQFRLDGAFAGLDSRALCHGRPLGRLVL